MSQKDDKQERSSEGIDEDAFDIEGKENSRDDDDEKMATTEHLEETPRGNDTDDSITPEIPTEYPMMDPDDINHEEPLISSTVKSQKKKPQTNTETINIEDDTENVPLQPHNSNEDVTAEDFKGKPKPTTKKSKNKVICGGCSAEYYITHPHCRLCTEPNGFYVKRDGDDISDDTSDQHEEHVAEGKKDNCCEKCIIL